jgi:hypothetical protein
MFVSRRDKRARATGRRGATDEGVYAQISDEVLRSPAARAMPDYAMRTLLTMAAQYRGTNNGDLAVTSRMAVEYGLPEWKLRAGLALLELSGLVELTRQGHIANGKGVCSLYALGWRPINPRQKYDVPTVLERRAPNRWATWTKPTNWPNTEQGRRRAAQGNRNRQDWQKINAHPTRVSQADPPGCSENTHFQPTRVSQESAFPDPPGLVPSKTLPLHGDRAANGSRSRSRPRSGSGSGSGRLIHGPNPSAARRADRDSLKSRLIALTDKLPHFTATDCAKALQRQNDVQLIRELLQEIEAERHANNRA